MIGIIISELSLVRSSDKVSWLAGSGPHDQDRAQWAGSQSWESRQTFFQIKTKLYHNHSLDLWLGPQQYTTSVLCGHGTQQNEHVRIQNQIWARLIGMYSNQSSCFTWILYNQLTLDWHAQKSLSICFLRLSSVVSPRLAQSLTDGRQAVSPGNHFLW